MKIAWQGYALLVARAFVFTVQTRVGPDPSGRSWAELARKIEDLGFAGLSVPDHLNDQLAAIPALVAAAAATTTLRVGTMVLGNDFRHPVMVVKEAATADVLSGGRFDLGLGAGWMTADYEASGIGMDPAGVRIERLEEALQVIKGCGDPRQSPSRATTTKSPGWMACLSPCSSRIRRSWC